VALDRPVGELGNEQQARAVQRRVPVDPPLPDEEERGVLGSCKRDGPGNEPREAARQGGDKQQEGPQADGADERAEPIGATRERGDPERQNRDRDKPGR
jgi:hypothetical protein